MKEQYLFISYARGDQDRVMPVVDAIRQELEFRAVPIKVWMDVSNLQPGESWDSALTDALKSSVGFLFFISPRALQSEWIRHELQIATASEEKLLIPIILHRPPIESMPEALKVRQWVDLSDRPSEKVILSGVVQIVDAVERFLKESPKPRPVLTSSEAPAIAANIARELRTPTESEADIESVNRSVFVVHGHSDKGLEKLEEFLTSINIESVILSRRDESAQSLFQKFMSVASKAKFAVVLLSTDDYGASRRQYDAVGVGERSLQFRSRQNVILELGFFYGRLGWENVFVVYEPPKDVFPNFERPSDLGGVVFDAMSDPTWKKNLKTRLAKAGFET